ncbi:hypothetical protein GGR32_002220 [Mesonia hippocampi]|uniref:Uncharacterized protein n=1 Tax=Mesonia hippocampi TaxID=1628250 RepID=A0A840EP50_9FLAO|nr:type VI-B CRISPR-associated RNA-guided ribonuclease Cas13b [Mesonia hippocampi]MBB4119908.1 hypothetical protein [Mesonia hippocampi]
MEASIQDMAKRIEYHYASIEDKHYFGGFLNLAQNNIDEIFTAFKERFGKEVFEFFKDNKAVSEYELGVKFLQQHLPVIRYLYLPLSHYKSLRYASHELISEQRYYFEKSLKTLICLIRDYRNFYTHHYHKPIEVFSENYELLDNLLLSVIRDVKKYRMKTDASKQLLKKGLLEELQQLKVLKIDELKKLKREGKKVNLSDEEAITSAILNDSFYHLLHGKDEINKYYSAIPSREVKPENNVTISESGLLFLMSIFLTKKQGEDLRSRVKGFKAKVVKNPDIPINKKNNSLKYMATHWVFGYLGYKGFKNRFRTSFTKDTLLAQIVDELSKVPDELYQVFSEDKKKEFLEDINEFIKEEGLGSSGEATVIHPVIRKRYKNKFTYFALRYLDEFVDFPSLRFQLHLGNYVHDKREKSIEGTQYVSDRIVKEKIKVFAKLSEASKYKKDYFSTAVINTEQGLELYPNPSYNFVGNNIPIHINFSEKYFPGKVKKVANQINGQNSVYKIKHTSEYREREDTKMNPSTFLKDFNYEKLAPIAMLSLNELPALLHLTLNHTPPEDIEKMIAQKIVERYEVLTGFKAGDKLPKGSITKKLLKAGDHEKVNIPKLLDAIFNEIGITNAKLQLVFENTKQVKDRKNKRKYIFNNKELGQEATWIADDLKRFMPKGSRLQWRGYHHSQLQKSLAFYDIQTKEAYKLLREFWDFRNESYIWNDNIKNAFEKRDFISFYTCYLKGRKELFENFIYQIKGYQKNNRLLNLFIKQQHIWNLFHRRLYMINTVDNQVQKLLVKPMQFPRGIFDSKPTYVKDKSIKEHPEYFAEWYVTWHQHQDYQKFYGWDRDYKNAYQASSQEKTEKRFIKVQESKIKKVQQQDVLLSKMASNIFNKLYLSEKAIPIELQLSNIYKTQQERKDEEAIARVQSQRISGDTSKNIIKSSSAWTLTVPYESENIKEPVVKLKELGKFKKFVNSKKVQTIFEYYPDKKWNKIALEDVLELKPNSYEVIRRDYLLKSIHDFEKFMIKKIPSLIKGDNNPNFKKYLATYLKYMNFISKEDEDWLNSRCKKDFDTDITQELKEKSDHIQKAFLLIVIRNKFSHNKLPIEVYFKEIYKRVANASKLNFNELYLEYTKQTILEFEKAN